jgi:hypothetical protein
MMVRSDEGEGSFEEVYKSCMWGIAILQTRASFCMLSL